MKRALTGLVAASIMLGTGIPAAFAASSGSQWFTMQLNVNGSTLSTPYGIAESDGSTTTTYIPLFYVNQALSKIGYTVSWNGSSHTWSLTTAQTGLDFSSIPVGTGNTSVTVNGTLVKQFNTIVQLDPSGGTSTTYIPIYYVSPLIQALGISAVWNGSTHTWSIGAGSGSASTSSGSTSSSSSSSSSSLTSPTISSSTSGNTSSIAVKDAKSGATLTLYDGNGNSVVSTTAQSDGTATFYNVNSGSYYVIETLDGEHSGQSNTVTISDSSPTAPTIFANHSNEVWYVGVNNSVQGATLTLFGTSGNKIATATANQYGYATFDSVGSGSYYVIEATNGQNIQSNAITIDTSTGTTSSTSGESSRLSTPSISTNSNSDTLTVNNLTSGATVTLYRSSNGAVYASSTAGSAGFATFTNVSSGTYYAVQAYNGQQSAESSSVFFQPSTQTPVISESQNGSNSATLTISNLTSGATVQLYQSNGSLYGTLTANSAGYATFNNVSTGTYYAVQTYNSVQSAASNAVTVSVSSLNTPNAYISQNNGNGTGSITVNGVTSGATVTLFNVNGSTYGSATANSSGYATFNNVSSGQYYATQTWGGHQSDRSSDVTIASATGNLATPSVSVSERNNVGTITVNNAHASATVTLYTSSGSVYATLTANSSGYATFTNVSRGTYYVMQAWDGYQSNHSNTIAI